MPDYVKVRAAIHADGGSAGIPEKVAQLVARRRMVLETTRELIGRLEKAQSSGTEKAAVAGVRRIPVASGPTVDFEQRLPAGSPFGG